MSKRSIKSTPKSESKNTLFRYFSQSPAPKTTCNASPDENSRNVSNSATPNEKMASRPIDSGKDEKVVENTVPLPVNDEEDEDVISHSKKRPRLILEDTDSEDDLETHQPKKPKPEGLTKFESSNKNELEETDESFTPAKKKKVRTENKASTAHSNIWNIEGLNLDFLKPENIRDAKKRRPNDPNYDPNTIYVPDSYLCTLTPAMRQWWTIKKENNDCLLLFKVGKFYELYYADALAAIKALNIIKMNDDKPHCGFPEQAYDKMVNQLIEKGYKVARVEQTETKDQMEERVKKTNRPNKFDKVQKREICQISELGTMVYTQQTILTDKPEPKYLLAVFENDNGVQSRYGVCFLDTSICDFYFAEFNDDKHSSRLLTLLAHYTPTLVLHERKISQRSQKIFKTFLLNSKKYIFPSSKDLIPSTSVVQELKEKYYNAITGRKWPTELNILCDGDTSSLCEESKTLVLKSISGVIWYLRQSLIDEQVFGAAQFKMYTPPDKTEKTLSQCRNMVLDAVTLHNLRVIGDDYSLLKTIDYCCTKFGKRLLQNWVCTPLANRECLSERQAAVKELYDNVSIIQDLRSILGKLPDLERLIAALYGLGLKKEGHPDSRAILYVLPQYNKKKILDFVNTLKGFRDLLNIPTITRNCQSPLIQKLTQIEPHGELPDVQGILEEFESKFDFEDALKEGALMPTREDFPEYDAVETSIEDLHAEANSYLKKQEKYFGCTLTYFGKDKHRFQIEVPERYAAKAGREYMYEGQKKGKQAAKRYHTKDTKEFSANLLKLEENRKNIQMDFLRVIFEKFSKHFQMWKKFVSLIAELDCLVSLAQYARNESLICVPEITEAANNEVSLTAEDSYHPCFSQNGSFISNNMQLGDSAPCLALLTGPNMGGKSTLMRQVGLLVVLAQIGSLVPAAQLKFSIVDRIFTRLGAADDIISGQSTFLVELSETSSILKHATRNSLVLLDELGRGTSTYDGNAIAGSVVEYLAEKKCRCLFSTHYHNLVDGFKNNKKIALGHMSCVVENEDDTDPTQEKVTFMYKYTDGPCPKSYGFNAAKLAGIPQQIIRRAFQLSKTVELIALRRKLLSTLVTGKDNEFQKCLTKLKQLTV